jgi:Recombination endonuclease VII
MTMAMTACERKQAQRARAEGYILSRESGWKQQGIVDASYVAYLEMIVAQHSMCAICGDAIDSKSPLDHDHKNGAVRAVLCQRCNLTLGKYENSSAFLLNAAKYLRQFETRS